MTITQLTPNTAQTSPFNQLVFEKICAVEGIYFSETDYQKFDELEQAGLTGDEMAARLVQSFMVK